MTRGGCFFIVVFLNTYTQRNTFERKEVKQNALRAIERRYYISITNMCGSGCLDCMYVYACMDECYVCMYARIYNMYVGMHVCIICMYVCYVMLCMYGVLSMACMYGMLCMLWYVMYVCMVCYVCMCVWYGMVWYVCMYVCMYVT